MTTPDLPAELKAALDARLQGLSRSDAAGRAALISQTYRDGGGSGAITSATWSVRPSASSSSPEPMPWPCALLWTARRASTNSGIGWRAMPLTTRSGACAC